LAEWIKVIILGIVEGLTEFLPVSSTGHLIVASSFLGLRESLSGIFEIFIQIGALFAVLGYYRKDMLYQLQTVRTEPKTRHFWLSILVAFIPAVIVGLLIGDLVDDYLFRPDIVGVALILGGITFIVIEKQPRFQTNQQVDDAQALYDVSYQQAFMVGVIQLLALVPGVSRSGASIIGGMVNGMSRQVATQFSFYLAIPTLGSATLYTLYLNLDSINSSDMFLLLLGTVVSAVVAWLSIGWLLRYVSKNNFIPFGYYRIIVGIIILVLTTQGQL